MNKNLKVYSAVWAIVLAVFHIAVFALPSVMTETVHRTEAFWIAYAVVLTAVVGQYLCTLISCKSGKDKISSALVYGYEGLFISSIAGAAFMIVTVLPDWSAVAVIGAFVILAVHVIVTLCANASTGKKKNGKKTVFVEAIQDGAKDVLAYAKTQELKTIAKKVYDEICHSDPLIDEALTAFESQMTAVFEDYAKAVKENEKELAQKLAVQLVVMVKNRNAKCKLLKRKNAEKV